MEKINMALGKEAMGANTLCWAYKENWSWSESRREEKMYSWIDTHWENLLIA